MNYKGATILPTESQSRIVILGKIEAREFENQAAAEAFVDRCLDLDDDGDQD